MKSQTTAVRYSYARRKDGLRATPCKDIPPKSSRPAKKEKIPHGKIERAVFLPPEYEVALQEMYPDVSIPIAIRKFIMENIDVEES